MKTQIRLLLISILFGSSIYTHGQITDPEASSNYLYKKVNGVESRAVSFENPNGLKGKAGMENIGAKGHAFERIKPGETKTLFDIQDMGVIRRFCMTIDPILMTPKFYAH